MMTSPAQLPDDVARRIVLAEFMVGLGACVFPLAPGTKKPLIPKRRGGGGFLDARADAVAARTFLSHAGRPNYGVVFPEGSDVLVLDIDGGDREARPDWKADWQRLYERLGPPGLTLIVRTPSGGRHAYYRWRSDLYGPMPTGDEMLGWTVRKPWKGYLVGPGSVTDAGSYEPSGTAIADLAESWARAAIAEKAERHHATDDSVTFTARGPVAIETGHRHAYLRDQARHLRGIGLSGDALFTAVMDLNRQLADPKTEDDVRRAIGDVEAKFDPDPIDSETGRPIVSARRDVGSGRKITGPASILDGLQFYTAAEIARMTPEVIDWAWTGYLAHGTIVELVGPPKAGKTTLILDLLRALVNGHPFLERATTRGPVVLLTEQGPTSLRAVLVRTDLADREDIHVLLHRDVRGHEWRDVVATAAARCSEVGARVLVVDTLPAFAGLGGESENNAGDALAAMEPLLTAAANGLAVLVNRHRRKGPQGGTVAGDIADEGRGSGAFSGAVDVILSLRRGATGARPTVRELIAASRFDDTPEKLTVELDEGRYVVVAEDASLLSSEVRESVMRALDGKVAGLEMRELGDLTGKARSSLQAALDDLVRTGDVERRGRGVRGDAHRWVQLATADQEFLPTLPILSAEDPGILSAETPTYYVGEVNGGLGRGSNPGPVEPPGVRCHFYSDHQTKHFRGADGWHCRICSPEEGAR